MTLIIGSHMSTSSNGGIPAAIQNAKSINCDILQIFSQSPKSLKGPAKKNTTEKAIQDIRSALQNTELLIVSHSPYVINLAKMPIEADAMRSCLIKDLEFGNQIGSIGSVVHMGKYVKLTPEQGLDNMEYNIRQILRDYEGESKLILETSCGQGTELLYRLENMAEFYDRFTEEEKNRIMFCIDTCHIFVAGYNISTAEAVHIYFNAFDRLIGMDRLALIHFNDSAKPCASCVDRHSNIGDGYISIRR